MTKQQWKDYLSSIGWVDTSLENAKDERRIRQAISELRKDGLILIPLTPHFYISTDRCGRQDVENFAEQQLAAWKTQYFNTIVPLKKYLKDDGLVELMGRLV